MLQFRTVMDGAGLEGLVAEAEVVDLVEEVRIQVEGVV